MDRSGPVWPGPRGAFPDSRVVAGRLPCSSNGSTYGRPKTPSHVAGPSDLVRRYGCLSWSVTTTSSRWRGAGFSCAARKPDTPPCEDVGSTRRRLLATKQTDSRFRGNDAGGG